jgi:hypothetical protein
LAKAVNDKQFPGVRFIPRIHESLNELAVRGRLTPEKYKQILMRCFERAAEVLFSSIFIQDIFDWWMETPDEASRGLFFALGEAVLTVTQFDFLELSGDLLGELYQRYFDRDTRKALGEFYTPREVVEFILDECGYKGQRGDRLLDPSCGSGTFLAAALRRYLKNATGEPKKILQDLTDGLQIVGFDINPFAVLMAQINYAALILSLYAEAIHEQPDFRVLRIPVFRTDSLRVEEREAESEQISNGTPLLTFEKGTLGISIYLPIQDEKKRYHRVYIGVPRYQDARDQGLVTNLEEYIAALACIFQAVRDPRRNSLPAMLRARFAERTDKLLDYLRPTVEALQATVAELKGKYDDGRFLKTIEDFVLAVSLKHDLQYDFVVGNPPYVRIQKIPEHVKENWEGRYEWAEHNYDIYVPFLERSVRSGDRGGWLGKGGHLGFILSGRFLNVDYGQKLREELPKSLRIDLLFDFRDTRVFGGALNYPAILIATRSNKPTEGDLEAARVFTSEAIFDDLVFEAARLRKQVKGSVVARGESVEAFLFSRARLAGKGWCLMPADERAIVDKLNLTSGSHLAELTASASGGFAGYQTSADSVLVFDEVGNTGQMLRLLSRHEGDGCSQKPFEIEKGALRPFLFGKDVGRWSIDWKHSWVMFPYDRYARRKNLDGTIEEDWNLIPCKSNLGKFEFLNPQGIELFEDRFPNAWEYLCKHENALRKREDARFKETQPEGHLWYGATYPRGLNYYFRPKLVLQVLSRFPSITTDFEGRYVFTAGGTAGVYGIVLKDSTNELLLSAAAVLNSPVSDFRIKQISSVFGSRFYSYGDQFIADLIIPTSNKDFPPLGKHSGQLIDLAQKMNELNRNLSSFPESFETHLSRYELDSLGKLCTSRPSSAQLIIELDSIAVEKALYGFEVHFGSQQDFEFEHHEHAECLAEALRCRKRRTLPLKEVLAWRLPVKPEGCSALLKMLEKTRNQLDRRAETLRSSEDELNDLVYGIYGVTPHERKVIEGFLTRFSSFPAGSARQETEEDESEDEE